MRLRDLRARLAKLTKRMREIADNPADNGELSGDQAEEFDKLKGEVEATERNIERAQALEDAERRMAGAPIAGGRDNFETECRNFSLVRAMAASAGIRGVDYQREIEVSEELARRTGRRFEGIAVPLSIFRRNIADHELRVLATSGTGSNLVQTDLMGNQFIDILRANLVTGRLGATVLSGLVGDVSIPKLTTSSTVTWVSDNSAGSDSTPVYGAISMTPKRAIMLSEFSRNMLLQSSPDIETLTRNDFSRVLAEEIDRVALRGGDTNEPSGVITTAGVGQVDMDSQADRTWDNILEIINTVETAESIGTGWVEAPNTKKRLMSTPKQSSGVEGNFIQNTPTELAGYPAITSTLSIDQSGSPTDESLIFGRWSDLMIGYWEAIDILVNPYAATPYSKGNIQIRGITTCDVALRHTESFCFAANVG